jgi:aarF domain-containing kinase
MDCNQETGIVVWCNRMILSFKWRRRLRGVVSTGFLMGMGYYLYTHTPRGLGSSVLRGSRTLYTAAQIALDYKLHATGDPEHDAVIHQRTGSRALELCLNLGGLFVKLGQYVATLNHAFPPEITAALSSLQDKARPRAWKQVEALFKQELGCSPWDVFAHIDKEPVASASLAQVSARFEEKLMF